MNEDKGSGRVPFTCTRCGKCCISLGNTIKVERKSGPRDYYCRDAISGNLFPVHIDAPYVPFFRESPGLVSEGGKHCPFLVLLPEGYACAVYQTRPLICRQFQCCTMRIFSADRHLEGSIKGRRSLSTDNPELREIWDTSIAPVREEHDGRWYMLVREILEKAGFVVELYV